MRKPPTKSGQVAPSASHFPSWGSEPLPPRVALTEGVVLIPSHKGSKVTRFIAYRSQKLGVEEVSSVPGEVSPPSEVPREQEIASRVAGTCYLQGGWGRGH